MDISTLKTPYHGKKLWTEVQSHNLFIMTSYLSP